MNSDEYRKAKAAGKLTIARLDEKTVTILSRRYDPSTGEELPQKSRDDFNLDELKRQLEAAEKGVAALREFVADLEAQPVMTGGE